MNNAQEYGARLLKKYKGDTSKLAQLNDNDHKAISDVARVLLSGEVLAQWLEDEMNKNIADRKEFGLPPGDYSEIKYDIDRLRGRVL